MHALARANPEPDLLLVRNENSLKTLATVQAALGFGRSIGVANTDVLAQLDAQPVPGFESPLHVVRSIRRHHAGLVCFTSGATGMPKGILRSPESWQRSFEMQRQALGYPPDSRSLIIGNLTHSLHLYGAMEALDRGTLPTVLPLFTPKRVLSVHGANILYATPTHLIMLYDYAEKNNIAPIKDTRLIMTGGAKFDESHGRRLKRLFPEARIAEFFGTTETSFITLKSAEDPPGSVGKVCPGVALKICNNRHQSLPPFKEGDVWVKSDMLFEDYIFGGDKNTRWQDGYLSVGDQGFLDNDGNFFFTGRKGLMVTIAGENVFIDVLERYLRTCIPEQPSAIVPLDDSTRGTRLVAAVQNGDGLNATDILVSMRNRFGALKAPRSVVTVPDWPLSPSGKIDRAALKRLVKAAP